MTFTIEGPPRTKKNSQRIVMRGKRRSVMQSEAYCAWEESAVIQLRARYQRLYRCLAIPGPFTGPVSMCAIVYRDRAVGDLLNYLAAVSDALEAAGVVSDDKLVVSVDGSRLAIDRARPRVEVEIEAVVGSAP